MDSSATKTNKMSAPKRLISDLSGKFTSSSSDKKENNNKNVASEARRVERETKRAEEDKKYKGMKPLQAMFSKAIAARSHGSKTESVKPIVSNVSVSEIKDKVRRKSLISEASSRNSVDMDFIPDLPVQSALDVYTKGNCKTLKDKFETDIQLNKGLISNNNNIDNNNLELVPRRKTNGLPDMFEQQKKRDESLSLNKMKDTGIINKESINGFRDRFEDSDSRKETKEKMVDLTKKQKNLSAPKWSEKDHDTKIEYSHNKSDQNKTEEEMMEHKSSEDSPCDSQDSYSLKEDPPQNESSLKSRNLPSINSSTCSDMKRKLQEKTLADTSKDSFKTYKPIRKLSLNQFEVYSRKNSEPSSSASVISNAPKLSDIKKRFVLDKKDSTTSFVAFKSKKAKVDSDTDKGNNTLENVAVQPNTEKLVRSQETPELKVDPSIEIKDTTPEQMSEKRSSKSQMQNYLLSKVLFDDNNTKDSKNDESMEVDYIDDTPVDIMNDPYFQEIEKYLSLIGGGTDDKKKKSKKVHNDKKQKKNNLKLKVVELDELKNKFEKKKELNTYATSPAVKSNILLEKKVDKFREKFESSKEKKDVKASNVVKRRSGVISSDLLCKFDSPEELERLKKQREEEREARRLSRLHKLEEEQRRLEEEARLQRERIEAERLEAERLEEEERERQAEEARIAAACEEMMKQEKEKAEARRQKEEAAKSKREKNEPALKKKKVLGRIQHIFEKEPDPSPPSKLIGSIKNKAEELFQSAGAEASNNKTPFQDSSLAGMSVNRFKDKFEVSRKQEEPIHLYAKSEKKKRVPLQTAIDFDNLAQEATQQVMPSTNSESQWSWKKKDQGQLAVETTLALIKTNPSSSEKKSTSSRRSQRSKNTTDELLKELHSTSERLGKKDAIQEHEMKMKEYEEFIDEIQSFLNEPIRDISDCLDEVRKEKKSKKVKPKKTSGDKSSKGKTEKQNKFQELIQFVKDNDQYLSASMKRQIKNDMEYETFIKVIDTFLSAPDQSVEEIEFKDRIETFLDSIDEGMEKNKGPDITSSCVLNKSSSLLPDVVEGGLRPRRRSLIDDASIKKSSSIADFQNELNKYRSLLESKEKNAESKWKIGKVDTSFLETADEDEKNLDGKRIGPPSAFAQEIQSKLVASIQSKCDTPSKTEQKKMVLMDSFVPKSDEFVRGMRDLRQFIYKNRTDLPIEVLDFDCNDKELISKVRAFAFSDEDKPLKEEIKIYLELATRASNSVITDSIKTDHVADMKKKIFESKNQEADMLYGAPRRKLKNLEASTSTSNIPLISRKTTDGKWEWSKKLSARSVNPTPSPPVSRVLSKSSSDATVFRSVSEVQKASSYVDPKEREAAILAKYGVKPRPAMRDSDSSSSSESDSEEEEDIKKIISQDPRLQSIYGDRLLSSEDIPRKSRKEQVDSLNSLRNILGAMRQPPVVKTNSTQNMRTTFEENNESPPKAMPNVQRSTSFANIKNFISEAQSEDYEETRPSWQSSGLSRSSSFHKFKSAIEKAEEESSQQQRNNVQVQAELDAIRSSSRLQRMFAINKPSSSVSKSRSNPALEEPPEGASDISQARENIRSAFESNHAKMSYGVKLRNEKPKAAAPKVTPASTEAAGKKWMYDTINKYFDVIVEDDESDEEEDSSSESDMESSAENEESDVEICDFSTIISSRNNYTLKKTKSSVKLRSMISSLMVEKSISVDSMNTFKSNLNSHLQKSKSNVSKT